MPGRTGGWFTSSLLHVARTAEGVMIERRGEKGQKLQVKCPPFLPDYHKFMRGVDRGDQLISQYNAGRRLKKKVVKKNILLSVGSGNTQCIHLRGQFRSETQSGW